LVEIAMVEVTIRQPIRRPAAPLMGPMLRGAVTKDDKRLAELLESAA
jgi:hypothetical protein